MENVDDGKALWERRLGKVGEEAGDGGVRIHGLKDVHLEMETMQQYENSGE